MAPLDLCLIRSQRPGGEPLVELGVPLLDDYLRFVAARCRPSTVLAAAYDLKVFFTVVGKHPQEVGPADVLAFVTAQRAGGASIDGLLQSVDDDELAVSLPTVRRRLSTVSGLYAFLHARGDVPTNPVPHGLPTRRERQRPAQGSRCCIECALLDVGPHRCQHDRSHGVCEVSSRHAGA